MPSNTRWRHEQANETLASNGIFAGFTGTPLLQKDRKLHEKYLLIFIRTSFMKVLKMG